MKELTVCFYLISKFNVSGNVNLIFNSQEIPSRDLVPRKILGDILRQVR